MVLAYLKVALLDVGPNAFESLRTRNHRLTNDVLHLGGHWARLHDSARLPNLGGWRLGGRRRRRGGHGSHQAQVSRMRGNAERRWAAERRRFGAEEGGREDSSGKSHRRRRRCCEVVDFGKTRGFALSVSEGTLDLNVHLYIFLTSYNLLLLLDQRFSLNRTMLSAAAGRSGVVLMLSSLTVLLFPGQSRMFHSSVILENFEKNYIDVYPQICKKKLFNITKLHTTSRILE